MCHRAGMQYQLGRFGDGHEIARHIRVRHRKRPAQRQLRPEQGNDAAAGAQHIAEPNHRKTRGPNLLCHRLQNQFGHALARTHHIGRSNRLVGGDQHQVRDARIHRCARQVQGAKHIVENALGRVAFNHRNMFIGGGMVDPVRAITPQQFAQPARVGYAAEQRQQIDLELARKTKRLQLAVNAVQAELAVVQQQQLARPLANDLAAQFAADAAARPGDQHHLVGDAAVRNGRLRCHRVASEQVFNVEFGEVAQADATAGQIGHAR